MIPLTLACFGILFAAVWTPPVLSEGTVRQTLAEALDRHARAATTADFDEHVEQWLKKKAKSIDRTLVWHDAYGQHRYLKQRPQYEQYQVKTEVSDVKYKKSLQRTLQHTLRPVAFLWFHNSQSKQPIVKEFNKTTKMENVYSWTVEKNLIVGASVTAWADVPEFLDVTGNVAASLDLRMAATKTKTAKETFKIAYNLTVEPQTSVKAEWGITERELEIPWEAEIVLTGYIAAWFEPQYNERQLFFIPVEKLQGGPFKRHPRGLKYTASGTFKAVAGHDSFFLIKEYPLVTSSMRIGHEDVAVSDRRPLSRNAIYFSRDGKLMKEDKETLS